MIAAVARRQSRATASPRHWRTMTPTNCSPKLTAAALSVPGRWPTRMTLSCGEPTRRPKPAAPWTPVSGQQFEYAQADISNRSSTKAGGDPSGNNVRVATYSVNNLNQYTNRTVPGAVDVTGIANAAATVTVNNQATYRKVEYYRKELSITNTTAPQWQGVTNKAVQSTTPNTVIGD